ncbi:hypothetical protein GL2_28310 [Microbulbifer sp. GL-2]|nr:hypothetical protein GL2_28310 [Microbulbifer sp. GL-2]
MSALSLLGESAARVVALAASLSVKVYVDLRKYNQPRQAALRGRGFDRGARVDIVPAFAVPRRTPCPFLT